MLHEMDAPRKPPERLPCARANDAAAGEPVVDSRELLRDRGEVLIRHEGRLYRLRRTRAGKLILTA